MSGRVLSVVLAEPDADTRTMYTEGLEAAGIPVVAVASVDQAHAATLFYSPHVVVTEVAMRHQDGFALLRRLRDDRRTAHLPVVALTTGALDHERRIISRAGFTSVVIKPCLPEDLAAEIRRVAQLAFLEGRGYWRDGMGAA